MKLTERRQKIDSLMDNIKKQILWAAAYMPEEWDDREIRQYIADRFHVAISWAAAALKERTRTIKKPKGMKI